MKSIKLITMVIPAGQNLDIFSVVKQEKTHVFSS